jgi:hypothetical protein
MNIHIKNPRTKQWLWFAVLWFGGLLTVTAMSYIIKIMMGV